MPAAAAKALPLDFSRHHPVRCLWCGRELQSNVIARRKVFFEEHSHDAFPAFKSTRPRRMTIATTLRVDLDLLDDNPWQP